MQKLVAKSLRFFCLDAQEKLEDRLQYTKLWDRSQDVTQSLLMRLLLDIADREADRIGSMSFWCENIRELLRRGTMIKWNKVAQKLPICFQMAMQGTHSLEIIDVWISSRFIQLNSSPLCLWGPSLQQWHQTGQERQEWV